MGVPGIFLVVFLLGLAAGLVGGWHLGHLAGVDDERRRQERWMRRLERSTR